LTSFPGICVSVRMSGTPPPDTGMLSEVLATDVRMTPGMRAYWIIKTWPWSRLEEKVELLEGLVPELGECSLRDCLVFEIDRLKAILARHRS